MATGARVSNAYPTFPIVENSPAKVGLMLYVIQAPISLVRRSVSMDISILFEKMIDFISFFSLNEKRLHHRIITLHPE